MSRARPAGPRRRRALAALVLVVASCGGEPPPQDRAGQGDGPAVAPPEPSGPSASDAAGSGITYAVLEGRDTLIVERVERAPGLLTGGIRRPGSEDVLSWAAELESDGGVASLRLEPRPRGLASRAGPAAAFGFSPGRVERTLPGAAGPVSQPVASEGAPLPYLPASVGLLEQIVRFATATPGDSADVPVWVIGGPGGVQRASVVRTSERSARVRLAGADLEVTLDPEGRIVRLADRARALRAGRVEGA